MRKIKEVKFDLTGIEHRIVVLFKDGTEKDLSEGIFEYYTRAFYKSELMEIYKKISKKLTYDHPETCHYMVNTLKNIVSKFSEKSDGDKFFKLVKKEGLI